MLKFPILDPGEPMHVYGLCIYLLIDEKPPKYLYSFYKYQHVVHYSRPAHFLLLNKLSCCYFKPEGNWGVFPLGHLLWVLSKLIKLI